MKYTFPVALIVVALILGSAYWVQSSKVSPAPEVTTTPSAEPSPTAGPILVNEPAAPTGYTSAQVSMHSDVSSCWTTIEGKVYDLTLWIKQHPGGSRAILSLCGRDGTESFSRQHGGQARPEKELAAFYIGLAQ
ncbi:cytochrome b5 domain-containing protein [Patescibacteria group bacterium]|nr:cytochrome b5 domain-containing protein [Patescibacteria group bacterium]MBU1754807.1 cytochrome b5 domain-containing protein [Patescibacteria group bacterium]